MSNRKLHAIDDAVRSLPNGNLLLSGLALIEDVEDATGADLADEDYDTVGGFIMQRLGRIPHVGDRVDVPAVPAVEMSSRDAACQSVIWIA